MVTRNLFNQVVKDVLSSLYDVATLETHPALFSVIRPPSGYSGSKGEYVAELMLNTIEQLRPTLKDLPMSAPEWRPYLVLKGRYADGIAIQELADQMAISPRQLRRDHHKALEAITEILWAELFPDETAESGAESTLVIEVHDEMLDLSETIQGVYKLVRNQFESRGIKVIFSCPPENNPVITDRVILRQVLISLFKGILNNTSCVTLTLTCEDTGKEMGITFSSLSQPPLVQTDEEEDEEDLAAVKYWCDRIHARVDGSWETIKGKKFNRQTLWLPQPAQEIMLVIDDQVAVVNLFQRYMSQTGILVIGVSEPEKAVVLARRFLPTLITLDVMMPQMDGWELLQLIKLDDKLKNIPVIVCSAWNDPDLSQSLGASVYLKKPVTQKMLLEAVHRLLH